MSNLNQCNFIGRLGNDPETRYTPSGKAITSISIAVSESWKDKQTGEKQERTTWIPVTFFDKLGEIAGNFLNKGSLVFVSGKFTVDKWQDQTGADRYTTKIIGNTLQMLSPKTDSQPAQKPAASPSQNYQEPQQAPASGGGYSDFEDSIPF